MGYKEELGNKEELAYKEESSYRLRKVVKVVTGSRRKAKITLLLLEASSNTGLNLLKE